MIPAELHGDLAHVIRVRNWFSSDLNADMLEVTLDVSHEGRSVPLTIDMPAEGAAANLLGFDALVQLDAEQQRLHGVAQDAMPEHPALAAPEVHDPADSFLLDQPTGVFPVITPETPAPDGLPAASEESQDDPELAAV